MKNTLLGVFGLVTTLSFGQPNKSATDMLQPEKTPISISYYGNLILHPGIKLGLDYHLAGIHKTKIKKRKTKVIQKLLYTSPSIAFYSHQKSHSGLFISTDLGWRRYNNKCFYSDISLGLGYYGRINAGDTYEIKEGAAQKRLGMRNYFTPSLSYSIGQSFKVNEKLISIFTKVNSNFILGYNTGWTPELSLELGLRINPNFGLNQGDVKIKTKTKNRKK